jgi:ABC-type multidrug transport system ATPase subunit
MSPLVLEIVGLWKSYGSAPVLQGLDLSIASDAAIFGVVGPNGAGKTTLFGLVCGFLRPDRGSIALDGRMLARTARRPGEFAILAQDARFTSRVKLKVLLAHYARLQGFGAKAATVEALRALALVGLEGAATASPDELSHGMRKRLGIAQAFLGTPRVVILDEPTEGLDPQAAREVRRVIRDIAGQRLVLVSSHNLQEVEDLCREIAILDRGRIVRQEAVTTLLGEADEITFHMPKPPSTTALEGVAILSFVRQATWDAPTSRLVARIDRRQASIEDASAQLVARLAEHSVRFTQMQVGKRLEDRFIEQTRR